MDFSYDDLQCLYNCLVFTEKMGEVDKCSELKDRLQCKLLEIDSKVKVEEASVEDVDKIGTGDSSIYLRKKCRIVKPTLADLRFKTVVAIKPGFEIDLLTDDFCYPLAYVQVDLLFNDRKLFSASFDKLLSDTPWTDSNCAESEAWDIINGDLSEIGLGGLYGIDIYACLPSKTLPLMCDCSTIRDILKRELGLKYIESYVDKLLPPMDGFYNFSIVYF